MRSLRHLAETLRDCGTWQPSRRCSRSRVLILLPPQEKRGAGGWPIELKCWHGHMRREEQMLTMHNAPFRVALAQVAPVFLDRTATLEKACELMVDAGHAGARLIVFPAAFIPGYPEWIWSIPPGEEPLLNELYRHLLANAVSIPSETTDRLCRIAQRARINLVMGMSERDTENSGTTCYNTLLYINAQGQIVGKHRALVLTGAERLVWAQGDGTTLQVHQFPFSTMSGLIGGEHYLPLARYALYAWGTQLYIAAATEHGEPWLSTL
jgi:nitrilase